VFITPAHVNPFRKPSNDTTTTQTNNVEQKQNFHSKKNLWNKIPFSRHLFSLQRDIVSQLSRYLRRLKVKNTTTEIAGFLLLSFLYGIVHSLGPGHAKTLFISHSLSRHTPLPQTWIAGSFFAVSHTGMALIIFLLLRSMLGLSQSDIEQHSLKMLSTSGVLVMIAGLIILVVPFFEHALQSKAKRILRGIVSLKALAVIAGLAPCPGAFLVLVFSSTIGLFYIGLFSVAAISLGMALTVSIMGTLGGAIGNGMSKGKNLFIWNTFLTGIRIVAGLVIVAMGIVMISGHY